MLTRRSLMAGTLAAAAARVAAAENPARIARIGWLLPDPKPFALDPFRLRLRELGWTEGGNLLIEQRYTHGRVERYGALAADLVASKVDLLVTDGSAATRAAQRATATIPIVFVSGNPVAQGFVASLSSPGQNLTGVAIQTGELTPKRIQFLKQAVPDLTRLAILEDATSNLRDARLAGNWEAVETECRALGIQAIPPTQLRRPEDLDGAFGLIVRARPGGVLVLASPFFSSRSQRLAHLAASARLPAIYEHRGFVEAGGLMSYGPDHRDIFSRVATYADKLLRGAKPASLPVEQPTTFELVVNVKAASALNLRLPASLLARTTQIIE